MLNTSSRPSLTQFFIGFLVLLGRSLVDAERSASGIDTRSFHKDNTLFHNQYHYDHLKSFHKQYHHHQQAGLLLENDPEATRCELRDDEAFKLLNDNTSIISLLPVCNSRGENSLYYLVDSSHEKFFKGLEYANSEQIFHKTDANLTLMDVLIQKYDTHKIQPFLFMIEPHFEAADC